MGSLAWHGDYWGDEDDPEDPDWKNRLYQEQEAPSLTGLLSMLETLRRAQEQLKNLQTDFGKNYVPEGYPAGFPITQAVMMAELGLVDLTYGSPKPLLQPQEVESSRVPRVWDTPSLYEQYGELIETSVKAVALVTTGVVLYQMGKKMPTRGYHFRAPSFSPLSVNWPLWKVAEDNGRIIHRAITTGEGPEELIDDLRPSGQYGQGTAAAFGLFGWI